MEEVPNLGVSCEAGKPPKGVFFVSDRFLTGFKMLMRVLCSMSSKIISTKNGDMDFRLVSFVNQAGLLKCCGRRRLCLFRNFFTQRATVAIKPCSRMAELNKELSLCLSPTSP